MDALQWCSAGHILPSGTQVGGEEITEEELAEWVMVSAIT